MKNSDSEKLSPPDINDERKHLEGLLKDRINFYLVFAPALIIVISEIKCRWIKILILIIGTLVSGLMTLAIWRTHRLVEKALSEIESEYSDHPYIRWRNAVKYPENANKYLLRIPFIFTFLLAIMTLAFMLQLW
jgi:hypothetical protein